MNGKILIAVISMALLLPAMIEGQHPEVLLKNEISNEIAALTLENGIPLKPVFLIPEEKIDDMVREGIMKVYRDGSGSINLYEALIEVEEDPISYLRSSETGEPKHAYMLTADRGHPIYEFVGHSCKVRIPEYCDLQYETSFNLYNTHLVFPDGHFIESGVGWVGSEANWGVEGLNLYTFNSYNGEFSFRRINEGYEKEILLSVFINPDDYQGEMHATDLSSGYTTSYKIPLSGDLGYVDQTQEQHSFHSVWTPTREAHHFNNMMSRGYDEWIPWTYDVPTEFGEKPPLHFEEETGENSIGMVTWCG